MRTIALLTQKGGAGKTTLAASLAAAAAQAGEKVIALDLDPQASLSRWGKRREAANASGKVMVEPLEGERLPRLHAVVEGLAGVGFTLAIFDTAGADSAAARFVADSADLCLLPTRPTCLDVDVTSATFRAVFLAKRRAAFVLNQCPPTYRSSRTSELGERPGVPWCSGRADALRPDGFSGCHGEWARRHRIRSHRPRGTGSRGALGLDSRPVRRHPNIRRPSTLATGGRLSRVGGRQPPSVDSERRVLTVQTRLSVQCAAAAGAEALHESRTDQHRVAQRPALARLIVDLRRQ